MKNIRKIFFIIVMTLVFILIETNIYADVYIDPAYTNAPFLLGGLVGFIIFILLVISLICLGIAKIVHNENLINKSKKLTKKFLIILAYTMILRLSWAMITEYAPFNYTNHKLDFDFIMGIIYAFGTNLSLIFRFTKMKKISNIILGVMYGLLLLEFIWCCILIMFFDHSNGQLSEILWNFYPSFVCDFFPDIYLAIPSF